MLTKRFFLFVAILVIASLACSLTTPKSVQVCGEGNVLSENGSDIRCKTDASAPTAMAGGVVAQSTEVVVQPTPVIESTPLPPTAQAPQPEATCRVVNDYQLKDLTEVSSQPGSLIHVEWYERDGQPEYESVFPSGRYSVETPFPGGHVWEYSPSCSVDEVLDQVSGHIARRLQNLANNKGYRPWMDLVNLGFL